MKTSVRKHFLGLQWRRGVGEWAAMNAGRPVWRTLQKIRGHDVAWTKSGAVEEFAIHLRR